MDKYLSLINVQFVFQQSVTKWKFFNSHRQSRINRVTLMSLTIFMTKCAPTCLTSKEQNVTQSIRVVIYQSIFIQTRDEKELKQLPVTAGQLFIVLFYGVW